MIIINIHTVKIITNISRIRLNMYTYIYHTCMCTIKLNTFNLITNYFNLKTDVMSFCFNVVRRVTTACSLNWDNTVMYMVSSAWFKQCPDKFTLVSSISSPVLSSDEVVGVRDNIVNCHLGMSRSILISLAWIIDPTLLNRGVVWYFREFGV